MALWWFNARMVVSTLSELLVGELDVQGKTTQEAILGFQNSKIGLKKLARFNKVIITFIHCALQIFAANLHSLAVLHLPV